MKSTLLATAAAVGLLALPHAALASPPDRGFVEANIGFGWTEEDFQDNWPPFDDPFTYGAKTRWLFPLSQPVHFQADLFAEHIDNIFDTSESISGRDDSTLLGASAHLIHPMGHGRVGVAGSVFELEAFSYDFYQGHTTANYGLVALEGQYFLDHWTLFGQGGWFGNLNCSGSEGCVSDAVFFRANATYFFSPNTAINFDGQLFWGDDAARGEVSGGSAQVEGEHRFTDSGFAGFVNLNYEREEVDVYGSEAGEDTVTLNLGIRLYLDTGSLIDFSREGASMNTPTFHHALSSEGTLQLDAFSNAVP
jgi:hypothetical protein